MKKNNDITINANAIINLVKASSKLRIAMILIAFSFLFISTAKSQCSISVHKDANDFESSSNLGTATSLWVNVHFHLSNGDLTTNGDYVLFSGGTFTASIKSPVIANVSIPDGEVIADNTVSSPVTIYNGTMWITRVPLNYSNRDIFISGGIINSSTGFNAGSGGKKTSMSGTWSSNKNLSSKLWFYGLACYQPQFTYSSISVANAVYPVGVSNIKAGTPYPLISKWIPGGSGNGSGNYTGNMSNDDSFTQCVQSHTDLSVVKTISNSTPTVGSNVTFTLTATNNGPDTATLVVINDVLPSGYTLVSTTPSAGTWSTPNWAIGSLSNGASKTLTIVARVNPTGLYTNTATISGAEIDPVSSNNTSTITPAPKCVAPVLSLASGTYNTSQSVTLSTTTSGAIIKYTTDGSTPSQSNGTVYTNAVNVGSTSTLKAIAYKSGLTDSDVSSEVYTIQLLSVADPAFSPAAGTYSAAKSIAISTLTPGASIRYTTDGSIPSDVNGILYSVPVSVAQNTVLKAIAYKTNMLNSNVVSGNYAIKCVSPVMSTPTGTYNTSQSVILSTTTSGATIKYTTDGSTPSQSNGTVYTSAVTIGSTSTLKAIAYKSGLTDSDVSSEVYTIQLLTVADPAFSPAAGTYSATQTVSISSATSGASIRYTTDGSIPSAVNGTIYSVPVSVAQNTTLKAIAYKTNMLNSNVVSGNYVIKCVSPVMSTPTGTYNTSQSVILSTTTSGATIKYTTDGSTPSQSNGTVYTGAVNVGSTSTLKAIAYKSGLTDSDPSNAFYTITNDLDGDGITDRNDDYPNDSTRAFNNYFPSNGFGTLAFEDSWPDKGDQDLNDVVVDYRFKNVLNANNKLVETYAIFVLKASGAIYNNGFGFQLSNMIISSSDLNVVGSQIKSKYITLNSNGTEANQKKPTIIVFDNVFSTLQYPGVGVGVNTTIGLPYVAPDTISIHITYPANKYSEEQLDIAHFNPFIIVNKERGREVHLPDYAPTSLAKLNYFGTKDDNSIEAQNRYYKTNKNLSWALNIYDNFNYPVERAPINEVYTHFVDWVLSSGNLYPDWYKDLPGYRNSNKIFTHQVQ